MCKYRGHAVSRACEVQKNLFVIVHEMHGIRELCVGIVVHGMHSTRELCAGRCLRCNEAERASSCGCSREHAAREGVLKGRADAVSDSCVMAECVRHG